MIVIEIVGAIVMFAMSMFVLIAVCALLSESGDSITVSTKVNVKEDADKESSKVIREENDCDDVCDACGVNKKMQNSLICKECEEKINE